MARGGAICGAPVPVPGESVTDGSWVQSFGPLVFSIEWLDVFYMFACKYVLCCYVHQDETLIN